MRKLIICLLFLFCMLNFCCKQELKVSSNTGELCSQYIEAWKLFYPSRAYSRGFLDSIFLFEDYSAKQIDKWIFFNQKFLEKVDTLGPDLPHGDRVDLRFLKTQVRSEFRKWKEDKPHHVRILFPYGLYSEGWATLCERVALDAGWDNRNKLTRLAQLRKRLENANRAYTSVQAHCNGWEKEKVLEFSIQTSLLAPQFAKSLWGRLMRSPMQITSYFLGNQMFTEVYKNEMKRCGDEFCTLEFMDTILRAGPIPIDEFPELFKAKYH